MESNFNPTVAVVGLGYVGLPLAVHFGKKFKTIGYDTNLNLINCYKQHIDPTGEVKKTEFDEASCLVCSSNPSQLSEANYIIVSVPTPIDTACQPNLSPLVKATETVGKHIIKGATVIFESTVYPGVTEDVCVPILEKASGFIWKRDFHVGYSPERINPGDKEHTLPKILKVVSADDEETLKKVATLYESIILAGVYRTSTIKEAEAAKVIENTQRDLNIALMNELAIIFDKLDIDTKNVLKAAGTKWNFLPFKPGIVGGHCIGVDPYYLTYKAETVGYHPQVILAGRMINDSMGKFIAKKTIKIMLNTFKNTSQLRVGVLGITFKEDCPDLRNSKAIDIIRELESYGIEVLAHDPIVSPEDAKSHFDITLSKWEEMAGLGGLIIAVPHKKYRSMRIETFIQKIQPKGCLIDVKSILNPQEVKKAGIHFWRL